MSDATSTEPDIADTTAEMAVLARMLTGTEAIAEVADKLRAQDFSWPTHQSVFDAIMDLYRAGQPADALTVSNEIDRRGLSNRIGQLYLYSLLASAPTETQAAQYADRVAELARQRQESGGPSGHTTPTTAPTLTYPGVALPLTTPATHPAPPGYSPRPPARPTARRWPVFIAGAAIGAVVAAAAATIVTTHIASTPTQTAAPPSNPASPPPLPEPEANRQTCNAWLLAGDRIRAAGRAQSAIPKDMSILDPAVRAKPAWNDAVKKAADEYRQGSDILAKGITPGAATILTDAAYATVGALNTVSTAYTTFDAASGNAYQALKEESDTVDVLCERLAPR